MAIILKWISDLYIGFRRLVGWSRDREIWFYKLKSSVWNEPSDVDMSNALILLNSNEFTQFIAEPKEWTWVGVHCKSGEGWESLPEIPDPFPIPNALLEFLEEDSILQETSFYSDSGMGIPTKCTVRLFDDKEEAECYWKAYLDHMFKNHNGRTNDVP